jgi:adenylate cyclase
MTTERARTERRLAAVLAAGVAGYSRLIGAEEEGTLARPPQGDPDGAERPADRRASRPHRQDHRRRAPRRIHQRRRRAPLRQRLAARRGGAQRRRLGRSHPVPHRHQRRQRRGRGRRHFGDGVNVAARLEALADSGGTCVSARVQEDGAGRLDLTPKTGRSSPLRPLLKTCGHPITYRSPAFACR